MRWLQTVGMVRWCRIGPKMTADLRPVVSDWSGGVGMVCGMKRGISEVDLSRVQVQIGDPT